MREKIDRTKSPRRDVREKPPHMRDFPQREEQNPYIRYIAFVDCGRAIDSVQREMMRKLERKYDLPEKIIAATNTKCI